MSEYIIRAKHFKEKKSLGQNFLISKEVIDFILSNVSSDDYVLEIGPGIGFVTEKLIEKARFTHAVELDVDAVNYLNKRYNDTPNFKLTYGDILKTNICELFPNDIKIKVVANIPYYITTPILVHLLGEIDDVNYPTRNKISEIILMVQLEVGKRIVANEKSKNKEYGMLSILSNFWADTEIIKNVPKNCFYPMPKVDSCLVKFKINNSPKVEITPNLKQVIKALFSLRRKNIKNCLMLSGFKNVEETLKKLGMPNDLRGENLSINEFYKLSLELQK